MKKSILILGVCALMLSACNGNKGDKADSDSLKIADLTEEYKEATNFNDSLMLLMGDIYTGLDSINAQEGLLYNMGNGEGVDRRAEIRHNLSSIRARLAANRQLLAELEAKIKASGEETGVMSRTIAQLKQHIESQNQKIAQLESDLNAAKGEIANLNTKVEEGQQALTEETAAKEEAQQQAVAAENAANVVYYAVGTSKELKEHKLIEKKFLRSTKVLKGNFDMSYFVKGDKRTLKSIPTNSKKPEILTNMPADSYRIVGEKNGLKTIEVTNPEKFWSLSNFLVVKADN